jgi:hypothetical protein
MGRACSTDGEKRNVYRILMGKPEGKRILGRPRRRWKGNIKTDLREMRWGGMDWIDQGSCEYGNETSGFIKCWEILKAENIRSFGAFVRYEGVASQREQEPSNTEAEESTLLGAFAKQ